MSFPGCALDIRCYITAIRRDRSALVPSASSFRPQSDFRGVIRSSLWQHYGGCLSSGRSHLDRTPDVFAPPGLGPRRCSSSFSCFMAFRYHTCSFAIFLHTNALAPAGQGRRVCRPAVFGRVPAALGLERFGDMRMHEWAGKRPPDYGPIMACWRTSPGDRIKSCSTR